MHPEWAARRLIRERVARGYRTVALEEIRVLARIPPVDIMAAQLARVYPDVREMRNKARNDKPVDVDCVQTRAFKAIDAVAEEVAKPPSVR